MSLTQYYSTNPASPIYDVNSASSSLSASYSQDAFQGIQAFAKVTSGSANSLTLVQSQGIANVKHAATGTLEVHFSPAFSNANYTVLPAIESSLLLTIVTVHSGSQTASTCSFDCKSGSAGTLSDPASWHISAIGY